MSAGQPTHLLPMLEFLQAEGARAVVPFIDVGNRLKGLRGGHCTADPQWGRCRRRRNLGLRSCRSHLLLQLLLLRPILSPSFRSQANSLGHALHWF